MTTPAPSITRGLPLIGHLPWFYADTNRFLLRLARAQGDVASFRLGREEAFLLSHPDHVQQVLADDADAFRKGRLMQRARRLLGNGLLTSEGVLHHRQRRRLQPAFCRQQITKVWGKRPTIHGPACESVGSRRSPEPERRDG